MTSVGTRITDVESKHGIALARMLAGHKSVATTERHVVGTGMTIVKPIL